MTVSDSALAYVDVYAKLDAALEDPAGVRLKMDSLADATYFRLRCHQARKINRRENTFTYEKGHPLWRKSAYDVLVLRIRQVEGAWYLYFERSDIIVGEVESLSDLPMIEYIQPKAIEHVPVKLIEAPGVALRRRI